MKNVFKKACVLGSAALLTMGMSSSMVGAAAPSTSTMGALYGQTVAIGKGSIHYTLMLELPDTIPYDGNSHQLITSVTSTDALPTGAKLYLRIKDANAETQTPTNSNEWVEYADETSLTNEHLQRSDRGTYNIYYYIDGGENYNDVSTTS